MTQNTQIERHQLGQLIGANKRDHYYELHYSTGEVARLYILAEEYSVISLILLKILTRITPLLLTWLNLIIVTLKNLSLRLLAIH